MRLLPILLLALSTKAFAFIYPMPIGFSALEDGYTVYTIDEEHFGKNWPWDYPDGGAVFCLQNSPNKATWVIREERVFTLKTSGKTNGKEWDYPGWPYRRMNGYKFIIAAPRGYADDPTEKKVKILTEFAESICGGKKSAEAWLSSHGGKPMRAPGE